VVDKSPHASLARPAAGSRGWRRARASKADVRGVQLRGSDGTRQERCFSLGTRSREASADSFALSVRAIADNTDKTSRPSATFESGCAGK